MTSRSMSRCTFRSLWRRRALVAVARFLQFAADRRAEARQVLLGDEVVGARPEDRDRRLLVDGARDDDEGQIQLCS